MKHCNKCGITKEAPDFYKNNSATDGMSAWCKDCSKKDSSKRRPGYKKVLVQSTYGITYEDLEDLYRKQQGRCKICGDFRASFFSKGGLYVDHDHLTGEVRGLLCNSCNVMLGLAKDDVLILEAAKQYLISYKQ